MRLFARTLRSDSKTHHRLVVISTCVAGIMVCQPRPVFAQAASGSVQISQLPIAVRDAKATAIAPYDPTQMLRLVLGLQPPNLAAERQFLLDLQTKGSPQFHRFLTAAEWNARFAPSIESEQAVVNWAQASGLTVTNRYPNRLVVDVEAPVAIIQTALNVAINTYQTGGTTFFSNDRNPSIPAALSGIVHSVIGLNNIEVLTPGGRGARAQVAPVYVAGPVVTAAPSAQWNGDPAMSPPAGPCPLSPYTVAGFQGPYDPCHIWSSNAYDFAALYNLGHCCNPGGAAVTSIAIATSGAWQSSDLLGFVQESPSASAGKGGPGWYGLALNQKGYYIDGTPPFGGSESTMDIEWATAMSNSFGPSTATAEVIVYSGANDSAATFTDVFQQMVNDGFARVMSTSWGCAEISCYAASTMDTDDAIFTQMVGEGWTLVAAAGDNGAATGCMDADAVQFPASDPNVVAAGGTSLTLINSSYNGEVGWTGYTTAGSCANNAGGGGGGISAYFNAPPYQVGHFLRELPDIALNAGYAEYFGPGDEQVNDAQWIYFNGQWQAGGGTSIVAPEVAGFFAQANAYLYSLGNVCADGTAPCAPLGAVFGPSSYYFYYEGLNAPDAKHYPFYDITAGCNSNDITIEYSLPVQCAGVGYDMLTGWGSANMLQLAWMINGFIAGTNSGPVVSFSGPPVNHWYNLGTTSVSWTVTDTSSNGKPLIGVAGYTATWDTPIDDAYTEPAPGYAGIFNSFYYGPTYPNGTSNSFNMTTLPQGWHTVYVDAWDNAGWPSGEQLYGPIGFDNIPPTTSEAATPAPNGAGWNDSTVQVTLTATDPGYPSTGSGIYATYIAVDSPGCSESSLAGCSVYAAPVSITAQGRHTVLYFSRDLAGNFGTPSSFSVNIDETPPHTTAGVTGVQSVQVTLTATDNLSGVASTVYQIGGGSWQTYSGPFVVSGTVSQTVSFYSTDDAGNVESTETITVGGPSYTISGRATLYGSGLTGATVTAVTVSGSESFTAATGGSGAYSFTVPASGSYTVTASGTGTDYYFYPYPASVTFTNLNSNQTANFQAAVPSDFNHAGHPDVIWEEPTIGWAQVWYLGGAEGVSVTEAANLTQANPWRIVGIADFNGDGNPDVVWQDPVSGAVQVWYLGGPLGDQLVSAADITTSNPWRVVSVADFNGDGRPDLLWQDPTNGFSQVWYLGGPQGITLLAAADLDQTNPWRIVGTGDFNGDGVPDVLWQDPVSGTVQIWYMGGTTPGSQGTQLISAVNLTGAMTTKLVAIADFNQDGHPDVVFQDPATGAATVYYYSGPLGTIPAGTAVLSTGNPWYIAGPH
jgi:hypothetical protein